MVSVPGGEVDVTEELFLDPWREFHDVCRQADELFDAFLKRVAGPDRPPVAFVPRCDISRTAREYLLRVALPGVLEEDIDLTIAGSLITIRGEREDPLAPAGGDIVHREFHDGYFERSFSLPFSVDPEKVNVQFTEGILFMRVARPEA
jgi:HSP20 family protein